MPTMNRSLTIAPWVLAAVVGIALATVLVVNSGNTSDGFVVLGRAAPEANSQIVCVTYWALNKTNVVCETIEPPGQGAAVAVRTAYSSIAEARARADQAEHVQWVAFNATVRRGTTVAGREAARQDPGWVSAFTPMWKSTREAALARNPRLTENDLWSAWVETQDSLYESTYREYQGVLATVSSSALTYLKSNPSAAPCWTKATIGKPLPDNCRTLSPFYP